MTRRVQHLFLAIIGWGVRHSLPFVFHSCTHPHAAVLGLLRAGQGGQKSVAIFFKFPCRFCCVRAVCKRRHLQAQKNVALPHHTMEHLPMPSGQHCEHDEPAQKVFEATRMMPHACAARIISYHTNDTKDAKKKERLKIDGVLLRTLCV